MPALASQSQIKKIDLSARDGPSDADVVLVPFPKNTVGVIFGQMIAEWPQRFNTYLTDSDTNFVEDPQVLWDANKDGSRFNVTAVQPTSAKPLDPNVFSLGPYTEDRYIAIYCSHKAPGDSSFKPSEPKYTFESFQIGGKNAITFTMVHAEDGGDTDFHDTVVGVSVN
ncbi:hypothetical protein JR316_0010163 [Psilocybe cubensis]|uniref:Uncharacterized protein n=2 Tax=Psilocybe cubensis TaxID=181762 RepID=A0ACB8GQU6_PSICU|nr:hypothetical protein JR316_0010163 [Psilocybe cubensis]KAH9477931.1 hypothetical protein JR316_0010163 [Psilocybe cubensis]